MTQLEIVEEERISWKTQMLIGGAIVGAIIGAGTSYLMARNSAENRGGPPEIKTMEVLKIAVSVFGLIRVIAALGDD